MSRASISRDQSFTSLPSHLPPRSNTSSPSPSHSPYPSNIPHLPTGPASTSAASLTGTGDGTVLGDYTDDRLSSFYAGVGGAGNGSGLGAGESGIGATGRLDLGNLNLVSWKKDVLVLDESIGEGSELGDERERQGGKQGQRPFNAISTVLAHPTKPPDPLRSSRKPLPPVAPSQIPALPKPPPPGYYTPYLEGMMGVKTGEEGGDAGHDGVWEAWRRAVEGAKEAGDHGEVHGYEDDGLDIQKSPGGAGGRIAKGKDKELDLPDLSDVPEIYFSPTFDLSNPLVWEQVVGSSSSSSSSHSQHHSKRNGSLESNTRQALARASMDSTHSHDLLSQHLDHLESHLVHEISLRTPSFFSALSNLQSLTSQTSSCLSRISTLRDRLTALDDQTSIKALQIVQSQQSLRVRRQVQRALEEIESLGNVKRLVGELAEMGDWVGALEGMEEVGRWWLRFRDKGPSSQLENGKGKEIGDGTKVERELHSVKEEEEDDEVSGPEKKLRISDPLEGLSLSTIPALATIPADLKTLAESITTQLSSALANLLTDRLESSPPPSLASSKALKISPEDERSIRLTFHERIQPLLLGLSRCDARDSIVDIWKSCIMRSVKEGMRMHLQGENENGGNDADGEDAGDVSIGSAKAQSLADTLRDMTHERFVTLEGQMFRTMRIRIELARVLGLEFASLLEEERYLQSSILHELVTGTGSQAAESTATPMIGPIQDILAAACELANARAAKVLVSRTPQHADLALEQFVAIFEQSWTFIAATEAVSGRVIVSLRGVITSQARAFLLKYHAKRLQASAKFVEEEQWNQVEISAALQKQTQLIVSSAIADPPGFLINSPNGDVHAVNGHAERANGTAELAKSLDIEGQTFFIVQATAKTLEMLEDYLRLVINLESVATDVMARVVEFLKSFNSRTCQVVLGAGAMRSAGLKNITAKHLALASQSLSVVICLLPYIREFVRRHLSTKQAVMLVEFDKLKRDYQEHQHEIHSKLVAIMSDRLAVHSAAVRSIDWEAKTPITRDYAILLVKECTTLHKVLSKYLSDSVVYMIMTQVVDAIRTKIGDEYAKVELKSEDGKKRMLNDATFIVDKVKDFTDPNMPSPIEGLDDLVRDKPTPKKQVQMGTALNGLLRRGAKGTSPSSTSEPLFDADAKTSEVSAQDKDAKGRESMDLAMDPPPALPQEVESATPAPAVTETTDSVKDGAPITGNDSNQSAAVADADVVDAKSALPPTRETDPAKQVVSSTDTDEVEPVNQKVIDRIVDSVDPDAAQIANEEAEKVVESTVEAAEDIGKQNEGGVVVGEEKVVEPKDETSA